MDGCAALCAGRIGGLEDVNALLTAAPHRLTLNIQVGRCRLKPAEPRV